MDYVYELRQAAMRAAERAAARAVDAGARRIGGYADHVVRTTAGNLLSRRIAGPHNALVPWTPGGGSTRVSLYTGNRREVAHNQHKKVGQKEWQKVKQPFKNMYGYRRPRGSGNLRHMKNCVEYKVYNSKLAETATTQGGLINSLLGGAAASGVGIPEGNGYDERVGRKIFISRLQIHGTICGNTAGTGCQQVRVMIVVDKQANGTTPTVHDLIDTSGAADYTQAFRNLENTGRFFWLMDRHIVTQGDVAGAKHSQNWNLIKRFPKGLHVTYDQTDGNGAAATDGEVDTIKTNNIWVFAVGPAATNNAKLSFSARVRYTD